MLHSENSPMASRGSHQYLSLFLLSLIFSSSCSCTSAKNPSRWALFDSFHIKATRHDLMNPPLAYPATPVTNPVTTPSVFPPVVTVPATNPIGLTPNPVTPLPAYNPVPVPVPAATNPVTPAVPVTNPVTPAVPVTNPVTAPPVTNPVTGPGTGTGTGTVPVAPPVTIPNPTPSPGATNAPAGAGQSWCVAKTGIQDTSLQSAIDYACGIGGADCSSIQQGASCYNPNTMQNHASVAFNSYYQKNPSPTSCDFGGTAMLTNTNPSSGSCVYTTSSSSSSSSSTPPGTGMPTPSTPSSSSGAAPISFGTPPNVMNSSYPSAGSTNAGLGNAPLASTDSISGSNHFHPTVSCIILMLTWIVV